MRPFTLAAIAGMSGVTGFALGRNAPERAVIVSEVRRSAERLGFLAYVSAMNRRLPNAEDIDFVNAVCKKARQGGEEHAWLGMDDLPLTPDGGGNGVAVLTNSGAR